MSILETDCPERANAADARVVQVQPGIVGHFALFESLLEEPNVYGLRSCVSKS